MKNGTISEHGKYADLMDQKGIFYDYVQQATHETNNPVISNPVKEISDVSDGRFIEEQKDITGHIPMDMSEGKVAYLSFFIVISTFGKIDSNHGSSVIIVRLNERTISNFPLLSTRIEIFVQNIFDFEFLHFMNSL